MERLGESEAARAAQSKFERLAAGERKCRRSYSVRVTPSRSHEIQKADTYEARKDFLPEQVRVGTQFRTTQEVTGPRSA